MSGLVSGSGLYDTESKIKSGIQYLKGPDPRAPYLDPSTPRFIIQSTYQNVTPGVQVFSRFGVSEECRSDCAQKGSLHPPEGREHRILRVAHSADSKNIN